MKKTLQLTFGIILFFSYCTIFSQQPELSTGKAPFNKSQVQKYWNNSPLADCAYAYDNSTSEDIKMGFGTGCSSTVLGYFTAPNFASSMCKGGDGNFYLTDVAPALYLFGTDSGSTCTLIGNITGTNGDQINGISYNPVNNTYYIISNTALYSLDISTLAATLIGYFSPSISGSMIDLCFDETGTCYAYEINLTPGAANAYIININDASLTTLGYVGFTPNFQQGMSYDFETGTIYLTAFNQDTFTGQLRVMNKNTGMTTLILDFVDQIAPFAMDSQYPNPCPVEAAGNPNPPSGTTDVGVDGTTLTWNNGAGTTNIEVWFGPAGNVTQVYSGAPITSLPTGTLNYYTTYNWRIVDRNDTCGIMGPTWTFMTEQNPNLQVEDFYPIAMQFWTGSTDGTTKTDGGISTVYPNVGWAVFDISEIPQFSVVQEVKFFGYVNAAYWPYWSATPMDTVNPITDPDSVIYQQILHSYGPDTAYIYSDEIGSFTIGWHNYEMINSAVPDLQNKIDAGQGWYAMGFIDRDFSTIYFINFDGWSDANVPYIQVTYASTPVEFISFNADVNDGNVILNWETATEMNNKGFDIERQVHSPQSTVSKWEGIGFVGGSGTSSEPKSYSFTDNNVLIGKYKYRLKQIDFDGSYKYSREIEVNVTSPNKFSLEQNYPNPFNPATQIVFNLAEDSKVTLKVFDVLGQEVATLLDGNITAGKHNITFSANSGDKLSSGVYLYRIEANGVDGRRFMSIKKMLLMK